jgi:hypothetical protein
MAWLGDDSGASPATRFNRSSTGYVRTDGVAIASSWADLTDGSLLAPLNVTATADSNTWGDQAWTDVDFNGTATWGSEHMNPGSCSSWTSVATGAYSGTGLISATSEEWTMSQMGIHCDGVGMQFLLYCFEQ